MARDISEYFQIEQQNREQRFLDQHLETFRKRIQRDELSMLEIREMAATKRAELESAGPAIRDRLMGELELLDGMAREFDPEPTVEERIAGLREHGFRDAADGLEHAQRKVTLKEDIERMKKELLLPDLSSSKRSALEYNIEKSQETLAELEAHHPVHERQAKAKDLRDEAHSLRLAADAFGHFADNHSQKRHREMIAEADDKFAEAEAIENGTADDGA